MLRVIKTKKKQKATLSAPLKTKDFEGTSSTYLQYILDEILPKVKQKIWLERVDIFIEKISNRREQKIFRKKPKKGI